MSDQFPYLSSPWFDRVRIPRRETAALVGERLCRQAGVDPEMARSGRMDKRNTPSGLIDLRCRIAAAMRDAGVTEYDMANWFDGVELATLRRYVTEGRAMEATR